MIYNRVRITRITAKSGGKIKTNNHQYENWLVLDMSGLCIVLEE